MCVIGGTFVGTCVIGKIVTHIRACVCLTLLTHIFYKITYHMYVCLYVRIAAGRNEYACVCARECVV